MADEGAIEPFGNETVWRAQLEIHASRECRLGQDNLFEQGRTVGFLDVVPSDLLRRIAAAGSPPRMLLEVTQEGWRELASLTADAGYRVSGPLMLMRGDAAAVLPACRRLMAGGKDHGLRFVGLHSCSSTPLICAVQDLQQHSGITPLPGWFLRGRGVACFAIAALDIRGRPVAAGAVQRLGTSGHGWLRGMALAICVAPDRRGQGLGTLLNAHLLACGWARLGWDSIEEILEDPVGPSSQLNWRCGLRPASGGYLFVERSPP